MITLVRQFRSAMADLFRTRRDRFIVAGLVSFGALVSAAELLLERGAKEVWAMATHGVLSPPAVERLSNSPISRVVLTNTLPLAPENHFPKVEVLSVAKIIADALAAVFDETSVSELFDGENQS